MKNEYKFIGIRVRPETKEMIQRAAEADGRSVSSYMIKAAAEYAAIVMRNKEATK